MTLYALTSLPLSLERGNKKIDPHEAEKKAIRKRVKSRRYSGKYKGRGKYKPKDPA
jgi:hypothetical protein